MNGAKRLDKDLIDFLSSLSPCGFVIWLIQAASLLSLLPDYNMYIGLV